MDCAKSEPAALRRIAARVLLVLGGAVASTAAAWLLSSATASAETSTLGDPVEPVAVGSVSDSAMRSLTDTAHDITRPVGELLRGVGDAIREPAPPQDDPVRDIRERAEQAADRFGAELADRLGLTPELPVDDRDLLPGADTPGPPSGELPLLPAPGDAAPAAPAGQPAVDSAPVSPATAHVPAAGSATERAHADGMTRRGSPARPLLPTGPGSMPVAPASMPAPTSTGFAGGGTDSQPLAMLPHSSARAVLSQLGAIAADAPLLAGGPGAQPGVTPD